MAHIVYIFLWLLAGLNLALGGTLIAIFSHITTLIDFGETGTPIFKWALFIFSLITILAHQLFIYESLHKMEHHAGQWIIDYPNWFNTRIEKTLRLFIFIVLLAGVGKIPGLESSCHKLFATSSCTAEQKMIVLGSSVLFLLLTIWNLLAGIFSKKWDYFWSDFLAFLFWGIIAFVVLGGFSNIGFLIVIPLLILITYSIVIGKRISNSIKHNKKSRQQ